MTSDPIFAPPALLTGGWPDVLLVGLGVVLAVTLLRIRDRARAGSGASSVELAWLRLVLYACWSTTLAIVTGVFGRVFATPPISPAQLADLGWLGFTAACFAVEAVAYGAIWRAGTRSHGRRRHLPSIVVAGVLWGVAEAQVFLSIWAIVERVLVERWQVAVVAFLLIAAFKGTWQSRYWDIRVSPEHNLPEWNVRKVLFAHIPNLVATLAYLAVTESAALFVAFQVTAILISAFVMRFPAWTEVRAAR